MMLKSSYQIINHKGTYEVIFGKEWAGIPLSFYNLSKAAVKRIEVAIQKKINRSIHLVEFLEPLLYKEDIRCRELDAFIEKFKPLAVEGKLDEAMLYDDWPRYGAPKFLFEVDNPYQEANKIRSILKKTRLSYNALKFYLSYYGGITKSKFVIEENKSSIKELQKKQYAIEVKKMPTSWLLNNYFPLKVLREVAKKLKVEIKARKKSVFVEKLLTKAPEKQVFKIAAKIHPVVGYHFKTIENLSVEKANWFYDYLTLGALLIFGTLEDKIEATTLLHEYGKVIIRSTERSCSRCKQMSGKIVTMIEHLPPYHLGCGCIVSIAVNNEKV